MRTIIDAEEVIERAFNSKDQMSGRSVTVHIIRTAELKFLKPELGAVYDAVSEGSFRKFSNTYVKPALAFYVKYMVLPELACNMGDIGIFSNKNTGRQAVSFEDIYSQKGNKEERGYIIKRGCGLCKKKPG